MHVKEKNTKIIQNFFLHVYDPSQLRFFTNFLFHF